jgi:CheY-like chemotaxis protein
VLKALDLDAAFAAIAGGAPVPQALLVDYHLDRGNGIEAIGELRRRFGSALPAILITADRSPQVRENALAAGIQVLHKPLKPAALRALLAQCRVRSVAAAE